MKNNLQNGMAMPFVVVVIALAAVIGGISYFVTKQKQSTKEGIVIKLEEDVAKKDGVMMGKKESEAIMKKDGDAMMTEKESEMLKGESIMEYVGTVLAGKSTPLLDFKKTDYDTTLKTDKLIVLYFYANWCPICRLEFPKMQNAFDALSTEGVIGFRVNYNDTETDDFEKALARKFGVAYQHTKVFVKNGIRVLKSPESWDTERYSTEINKFILQ